MRNIILFSIFCIIFISFLANPAPPSLEFDDLLLIALPLFLSLFCFRMASTYSLYQVEYNLLIAVLIYLCYLLISVLIAFLHGVPFLEILRAIGPYLNFFPLLLLCFLPSRLITPWSIALILIIVGLLQAGYQIFLYFNHPTTITTLLDVLKNRITLIDPRTTLPIILSTTILPLAILLNRNNHHNQKYFGKKHYVLNCLAICLTLFGLFGAIVTLTRAIILSIFFGWLVFLLLYLYQQYRQYPSSLSLIFRKIVFYIFTFTITIFFISLIPKIHLLEQGLLTRFNPTSSFIQSVDYSNGRLYDEWLPAITTWVHSDLLSLLFGIGAGKAFITASGEERTYIHNLSIYSLVYGGIFGFISCFFLYLTTFKTLVIRSAQTEQTIYLAFAALLSSLFFYGQLFAVHKGLAFNAMLFLMIALAFCEPLKR